MSWNIVSRLRETLARERGAVVKDWGGRIPVALGYPNAYHAGMSNLGFQAVYAMLNAMPDVVCERVFLPDRETIREHRRTNTPLLSLEHQRPAAEFELLAFSVSHENDYPNLAAMLKLAGLAVRREDRRDDFPLVLAGGVCIRTNPEPLADFLDLALLGDGETMIPHLIRAWREVRSNPLPKRERTLHLGRNVPGAYAPASWEAALDGEGRLKSFRPLEDGIPERIPVVRAEKLPEPALHNTILTPETEFADTRLIEIGRGCPHGCRFCLAGYVYRPVRFAKTEAIMAAAGDPENEGQRIGLVSPAPADHPEIESIVRTLTGQGRTVTLSSLRIQSLTPGLVEALSGGKLRSAAIAPEAGSQELRDAINKRLTEQRILEGVALMAEAGLSRLKLYFMIGLPYEIEEDVQAVVDLTLRIRERLIAAVRGRKLAPEITLTLSSFVPKPHTPFGGRPMTDLKVLKKRASIVQKRLGREKALRVNFDPPRWSYLQTLFSRGDRRIAELIELLGDDLSLSLARKRLSFNPDDFVFRPMDDDPVRPWDFIDYCMDPGFLRREVEKAGLGKTTPDCKPDTCRLCGICGPPAED